MSASSSRIPNRFGMAFVIFLVLILVGTAGYRWLEGMSPVDALYMTVITISTVGFSEVRSIIANRTVIYHGADLRRRAGSLCLTTAVDFIISGGWRVQMESRR